MNASTYHLPAPTIRRVPSAHLPCEGFSVQGVALKAIAAFGLILVNKLGLPGNILFFAIVMAMIMAGTPRAAVMGMTLALLALCANTAFVVKTAVWTIARFINIFMFSGRFVVIESRDNRWLTSPSYVSLLAFVIVAACCSLASGYYVHIAMLKLFSFWIGMTGFFACIHTLRRKHIDVTEWFVAQAAAVCLMCAASLALGVAANFKEGMVAKGLHNLGFYHSQSMGPAAALLCAYLASVYLFAGHRNRWICLPLIGFLLYCLYLSGSRTGLGALIAGLATLGLLVVIRRSFRSQKLRLNIGRAKLLGLVVLGCVSVAALDITTGGRLTVGFVSFLAKKGRDVEAVSLDDALSTRLGSIELSYHNFKQSPVFGIGFQVATTEFFKENASLFYAPVEKGFLPTAVLEEVGLVGTTFFVVFLTCFLYELIRDRNVPGTIMFVTMLVSNLGEASFFALAGHGAYAWMLVIAGIALGDRCFIDSRARRPTYATAHFSEHVALAIPRAIT